MAYREGARRQACNNRASNVGPYIKHSLTQQVLHYIQLPNNEMNQSVITSQRINSIANITGSESYLEIGVWKGETFAAVNMKGKHGVDPAPLFDYAGIIGDRDSFSAKESDQFFVGNPPIDSFDIIFIDGLHTFEQAYRDFTNSICYSHKKTIWLIDDIYPSDYFSSLNSAADCFSSRNELGIEVQSWHGDVYKLGFLIHDFYPLFDFRLIVGNGNPQLIAIFNPRKNFKPKWNSLEQISRLSYSHFLLNKTILNECNDDEALAFIAEAQGAKSYS